MLLSHSLPLQTDSLFHLHLTPQRIGVASGKKQHDQQQTKSYLMTHIYRYYLIFNLLNTKYTF